MFLSSKEIDYKEAIKRYIERTGNDLYKLVEKGEVIQLEEWHFITKENFESAKRKLAEYQKVIDNDILENSKINKFHIIQLCNHNIERIREQFKEYEKWLIDTDPDFIDCTFLFSFFKTIFEYPKIVIEAYGKYNGYEDTHQRIYYQHEIIFSFLAEKNQRIKLNEMDFQSFFNKRIFKKDEYLINVFMLIDTQLKFIVNIDYPFLHIAESEIFRTYFNFILEIRDYYISAFKDVKLKNIEHFENILKSTPEKKEHGTPPPTVETQQESETESEQQQNPYPRIFTSLEAFQLCKNLMKNNVTKNQLADVSFYFNEMKRDEYIFKNIQQKEFLEYLQIEHDIPLEKLRPDGYNVTDAKKQIYTTVKSQFKLH